MMRYFLDPMLRGPTLGSMLMCLSASLMGVFLFVRKRSLLGETLSHATYPGVILGIIFAVVFDCEKWIPIFTLIGGCLSAALGLIFIQFLKEKMQVRFDAALCAILAMFFGFGVLMASHVQTAFPAHFRTVTAYLYGQAATMQDMHILLYGVVAMGVVVLIFIFYKELHVLSFDEEFAASTRKIAKSVDVLFLTLVVVSTVMGMRCVGVVLMSAMLIAPAVAARQFTHSLKTMLFLAGLIGMIGAFLGSFLSFQLSSYFTQELKTRISFPTGSVIVIVICLFTFIALLFAPKNGLVMRYYRIICFRYTCVQENLLKALWKKERQFDELQKLTGLSTVWLFLLLLRLRILGLVAKNDAQYVLSNVGKTRGDRIVRLHRLWEVYLVEYLGLGVERVHKSAEEMEHIITPQIEHELTILLNNPKYDPHKQPIPLASNEVKSV
jgi:manganese/zinc/iron transport system permease protein